MRSYAVRHRGVAVDCDCARKTRPHGTEHTYTYHRCGCEQCLEAHRRHQEEMKYRAEHQLSAYVIITPTADRLEVLRNRGRTLYSIAGEVGCSTATIYHIARREKPYCRAEIAAAIGRVPFPRSKAEAKSANAIYRKRVVS